MLCLDRKLAHMDAVFTLAVAADPKAFRSVYLWGAIIIGLVLVAFFFYSYFKKWMKDTDTSVNQGFTLSDLRKLRDSGEISSQEYEQTRLKMVAAAKKMTGSMPDNLHRRGTRAAADELIDRGTKTGASDDASDDPAKPD